MDTQSFLVNRFGGGEEGGRREGGGREEWRGLLYSVQYNAHKENATLLQCST